MAESRLSAIKAAWNSCMLWKSSECQPWYSEIDEPESMAPTETFEWKRSQPLKRMGRRKHHPVRAAGCGKWCNRPGRAAGFKAIRKATRLAFVFPDKSGKLPAPSGMIAHPSQNEQARSGTLPHHYVFKCLNIRIALQWKPTNTSSTPIRSFCHFGRGNAF